MSHNQIIITIIISGGLLGGLANFLLMFKLDYKRKECWIAFFKSVTLSLCASVTVPLFLQIISNNLIDTPEVGKYPDKNYFILSGFCVLASFFSKRFLEDIYSKLNKLDKKVDEAKEDANKKIETVTQKAEQTIKKVDDIEESLENIEDLEIPTSLKEALKNNRNIELESSEIEKIVETLLSAKFASCTVLGIAKETNINEIKINEILEYLMEMGLAERKVGFNGKDLWRILKYPIKIYSASYGALDHQVDVTTKIKEFVSNKVYVGSVDPATLGVEDPIWGIVKILKIHCRIKGREKVLQFSDGHTFRIE